MPAPARVGNAHWNLNPVQSDPHAYFENLIARPDFYKGYSLRPQDGSPVTSVYYDKQLLLPNQGGYSAGNTPPPQLLYDASLDAAVIHIGEYGILPRAILTTAIQPSDTSFILAAVPPNTLSSFEDGKFYLIETESVMQVGPRSGNAITVVRGQRGTIAADHAVSTEIHSNNPGNLENQLHVPFGTEDGHSYFIAWDSYWTASYLFARSGLDGYKAFQFESNNIWFECQMVFNGIGSTAVKPPGFSTATSVAFLTFRTYNPVGGAGDWMSTDGNHAGPGVLTSNPITPMAGTFAVPPNMWLRHFVLIDQRINDYDRVSAWCATSASGIVPLLDQVPLSVRPTSAPAFTVTKFWIELNTSQTTIMDRDVGSILTSAHRNLVIMKDPIDLPLLAPAA